MESLVTIGVSEGVAPVYVAAVVARTTAESPRWSGKPGSGFWRRREVTPHQTVVECGCSSEGKTRGFGEYSGERGVASQYVPVFGDDVSNAVAQVAVL